MSNYISFLEGTSLISVVTLIILCIVKKVKKESTAEIWKYLIIATGILVCCAGYEFIEFASFLRQANRLPTTSSSTIGQTSKRSMERNEHETSNFLENDIIANIESDIIAEGVEPNGEKSDESTGKEYLSVTVKQLCTELSENAMRAERDWNGKNVQITGYLSNIDSSGAYFSITETNDSLAWVDGMVRCSMRKNEDVKNTIIDKNTGDLITVYGTISQVGEIIGYSLNTDYVE